MPYLVSDGDVAVIIHTRWEYQQWFCNHHLCNLQIDLLGERITYNPENSHPSDSCIEGWLDAGFLVAYYPHNTIVTITQQVHL